LFKITSILKSPLNAACHFNITGRGHNRVKIGFA
jgi:hypothetical protein